MIQTSLCMVFLVLYYVTHKCLPLSQGIISYHCRLEWILLTNTTVYPRVHCAAWIVNLLTIHNTCKAVPVSPASCEMCAKACRKLNAEKKTGGKRWWIFSKNPPNLQKDWRYGAYAVLLTQMTNDANQINNPGWCYWCILDSQQAVSSLPWSVRSVTNGQT